MLAIIKKEISTFFSSPIAYLVFVIFLIVTGLFLWLFNGNFNIFNNGIASLNNFFQLAPWILLFLVPAVTMRSFSEERRQGTLELLLTKPISIKHIVLGKYLGTLLLIVLAVSPTLLYVYTISELTITEASIDYGSITGSYFGLLFLISAYAAIGLFMSSITRSQIVAFIGALFLCFFLYYAFEGVTNFNLFGINFYIEKLGMFTHYKSIARGVIDTRNLFYFFSITILFLWFTTFSLKQR